MNPFEWAGGSGLSGRRIIVTGAASGIGNGMLRASVAAGCRVVAVDQNADGLAEAVGAVSGPGEVVAVALDLSAVDAAATVVGAGVDAYGGVDGLFHAAAILRRQYDINSVTPEDFDIQMAVNGRATWFLTREVCEHLKVEQRAGAVVLFSSLGAFTGGLGGSWVYAATKGAVLTMVRGFARQYAPDGIRVNGISPGTVDTPMLTRELKEGELQQMMDALVPLRRVADPIEVANAGLFLLSDYASYVAGVTLDVDGGWNIR